MANFRGSRTEANILTAFAGECQGRKNRYSFADKVANKEGFAQVGAISGRIAASFSAIACAEKQHAKQYRDFIANLKDDRVCKREDTMTWSCTKCGWLHTITEPPQEYPACAHTPSYFELPAENR